MSSYRTNRTKLSEGKTNVENVIINVKIKLLALGKLKLKKRVRSA